jgi:large subunit ribosomal protein L6
MLVIRIPDKVIITKIGRLLIIKGPLDTLRINLKSYILIQLGFNKISLSTTEKKYLRLYYSLIRNSIKGVLRYFRIFMSLKGVGYKVFYNELKNTLYLKIGLSHSIYIPIPLTIQIKIIKNIYLIIKGSNWEQLTQFAFYIRKFKEPDIYKGKGFRFRNEKIKLKRGKKK